MDFEPGKILNRNRDSQATMQTKPQDQFPSNIKIVGDNVTEKDYEAFLEGFISARENPSSQEMKLWQKPKIQQAPYRPSVYGEQKIQKLPYRPSVEGAPKIQKTPYKISEDGGAKISLYSGTTPAYTQVKNTSQKPKETLWDKIKEPWEDRKNFLDELVRIYDNLSPETQSAMKTVLNPLSDRQSREEANEILENEIKKIHYGRNQYNVDLPQNEDEAKEWNWETELANCHQFTAEDDETNIKYVSPDGKREIIFDHEGDIVAADEDEGTYNYADPDLWLAHLVVDVLPWLRYGNTPEDSTERYQRLGGFLGFEN